MAASSVVFDTSVDPDKPDSRLNFHHYTTPWALVASSKAGADLSDPVLQQGISKLLKLQMADGSWMCSTTYSHRQAIWCVHDAVYALKTVVAIGSASMGSVALRGHADHTIAVLEALMSHLLDNNETVTLPETGALGA